MRSRTKMAISPATGTQACRAGLRAWALAILVVTWTGAAVAARADTIVLKGGALIEGSIVHATRNTLIVRRAIGGMHQMSIHDIEEVRIDLVQGEQISGQMLSWADGVYQIRAGGEVVRVSEGRILSRAPHETEPSQAPPPLPREERTVKTAAALPPPPREGQTVKTAATPPREAPAVKTAAAPALAAQRNSAKGVSANGGAAEMLTAEGTSARKAKGDSRTVVKASVDPAEAGSAGMVFNIELSRPAEQTIVLIYGTVDGTARAGTDYEPQQGVLTLAPGTRSTQVHVPLIEHQLSQDDTRFELFLAADPKVVEVVDQRITATIPGEH
jgi:hypothetical protein